MLSRFAAALAICFTTACTTPSETGPREVDLIIDDIAYFSESGRFEIADIAVEDGRFKAIAEDLGSELTAPSRIDGTGLFMIPGLWDMHVHLEGADGLDPTQFLRHGVTSVRDMGSKPAPLAVELAKDEEVRPEIYPSFRLLNGERFGPFQQAVTTEEEVVAAINEKARLGATQIKIHRALLPELLPSVVQAAAQHDLEVTGHIPLGMHPLDACRGGMGGIEHIGSFLEALISVDDTLSQPEAAQWMLSDRAEPLYQCLADNDVEVLPSLVVYQAVIEDRFGNAPPAEATALLMALSDIVENMSDRGIRLVTGTDSNDLPEILPLTPGRSLIDEMIAFEKAGIPPSTILRMASVNAAYIVGASERSGSIAPGKAADFIILSANPLGGLETLYTPHAVYRLGEMVPRT